MEFIKGLADSIGTFLWEKFVWFCVWIKQYDLIVTAILLLIFAFMVILSENQLQLKRKVHKTWTIFGLTTFMLIISFFIVVSSISFIIKLVAILFWVIYFFTMGGHKLSLQIMSAIYSGGIVYDNQTAKGPSRLQEIWAGKAEAMEKWEKEAKAPPVPISHSMSFKRVTTIGGLPILCHTFKFSMSVTAQKEQFYRVQSQLQQYLSEYNWIGMRQGKKYAITAFPKSKKNVILHYQSAVSEMMPWYVIPLGAQDTSTKQTIQDSMVFWKMHDDQELYQAMIKPKAPMENNQSFRETKESPMGLICGGTGGGKSVMLKTIIAHLVSKHMVKLYLSDPKGGAEFGNLKTLPEVESVATDLYSTYEIFKEFLLAMSQRYQAMGKLGINKLPLDGKVDINHFVSVGGNIFHENDAVTVRMGGKTEEIDAGQLKPGIDLVVEGNREFRIPSHWVQVNGENLQMGGFLNMNPMVFISDEYAQLCSNPSGGMNEERMIDEIQVAVESIARLGRAANVHIIIATQSATNNLFPASFKNNLHFRAICGAVTQEISRMIIGSEDGESIPSDPAGMILAYSRGNTTLYQGFLTESQNIINASSKSNREIQSDINASNRKRVKKNRKKGTVEGKMEQYTSDGRSRVVLDRQPITFDRVDDDLDPLMIRERKMEESQHVVVKRDTTGMKGSKVLILKRPDASTKKKTDVALDENGNPVRKDKEVDVSKLNGKGKFTILE